MPTYAEYKKQWKELKKRHDDNTKYRNEVKKQMESGTYQHPDYLILKGITEKSIKRQVGLETWEEKMDRESEEMMKLES